tara:strand:+ start:3450 stop:3905 length:456 start_codon:yes stop_codon:yes gene_type:complete
MNSKIIVLLIITFISIQAKSQTFKIDHYEPEGNGFVYDNISVKTYTESASGGVRLYAVAKVWDVSYKYNGKIYKTEDAPLNGTLNNLFKPRFTQFDIVLTDGKKLKYSLWPFAQSPVYNILCCESKYTVKSIKINTDNPNIDARIEDKLKK